MQISIQGDNARGVFVKLCLLTCLSSHANNAGLGLSFQCSTFPHLMHTPASQTKRKLSPDALRLRKYAKSDQNMNPSRDRFNSTTNVNLATMGLQMSTSQEIGAQFWPNYYAPPSSPCDFKYFLVFLGTYPATPKGNTDIRNESAPWSNPTCRNMHEGLHFSKNNSQRVGIVDLIEWYHPSGANSNFRRLLPSVP